MHELKRFIAHKSSQSISLLSDYPRNYPVLFRQLWLQKGRNHSAGQINLCVKRYGESSYWTNFLSVLLVLKDSTPTSPSPYLLCSSCIHPCLPFLLWPTFHRQARWGGQQQDTFPVSVNPFQCSQRWFRAACKNSDVIFPWYYHIRNFWNILHEWLSCFHLTKTFIFVTSQTWNTVHANCKKGTHHNLPISAYKILGSHQTGSCRHQ